MPVQTCKRPKLYSNNVCTGNSLCSVSRIRLETRTFEMEALLSLATGHLNLADCAALLCHMDTLSTCAAI